MSFSLGQEEEGDFKSLEPVIHGQGRGLNLHNNLTLVHRASLDSLSELAALPSLQHPPLSLAGDGI